MSGKNWFRVFSLMACIFTVPMAFINFLAFITVNIYILLMYSIGEVAMAIDEAKRREAEEAAEKPQIVIPPFAGK